MKIFFDTEFVDDGSAIDLISIGMVREDGEELYLENSEAELHKASFWVYANVLPKLTGFPVRKTRKQIALEVLRFVGEKPEFWAYFASYDWIALCQLYGRMIDVPVGWPHYCRDLKQLLDEQVPYVKYSSPDDEHHALSDARWVRDVYNKVKAKT